MSEIPPINLNDYKKLKIKEGYITDIILIENSEKQKFIAQVFKTSLNDISAEGQQSLIKEAQQILQMSHRSIIEFIGYSLVDFRKHNRFVLISNYFKNKPLSQLFQLQRKGESPVLWDDTKKLINIFGIASGMSYLHSKGIIISTLTPETILEDKNFYPKICNFGFLRLRSYIKSKRNGMTVVNNNEYFICNAPEIVLSDHYDYDYPADVYSFGMICYMIVSNGEYEIKNEIEIYRKLQNKERPSLDSSIPEAYVKLITSCWEDDPEKRPTFQQIVENLKNDPEFITYNVDEDKYREYIAYVEENDKEKELIKRYSDDDDDDDDDDEFEDIKHEPLYLNATYINLEKYEKRERLGGGGFGDVFKINEIETGRFFAAKIMKSIVDEEQRNKSKGISLIREVEIFSKMKHPNIVKFTGYSPYNFNDELKPTIIIEYLKNGSLEALLDIERSIGSLPIWNDTMRLINIYGIAVSMMHLHSNNIIHLDLKPGNVILNKYLFPKLSDFGLSIPTTEDEIIMENVVGTPSFIAPEIFKEHKYSKAADVYAFGILVYEIMNKIYPFEGLSCNFIQFKVFLFQERPTINNDVPKRYVDLIKACWQENPQNRPTFKDIVNDLKKDKGFITSDVNEQMFHEYIKYIDNKLSQSESDKKTVEKNFPFKTIELESIYKEYKNEPNFPRGKGYIDISSYQTEDVIEKLPLSTVFKVKDKVAGIYFSAIVPNFKIDNYNEKEISDISKEVEFLVGVKHPAIQQFHGFSFANFNDQMQPVIFKEFMSGVTLHSIIKTVRKDRTYPGWNDTKKLINIYGIAKAMQFLHSRGIPHANLNSKIIYVNEKLYPKLSEIGYSTRFENSRSFSKISTNNKGLDLFLAAPEILQKQERTESSDVYTYSLIVYEILTNEFPFNNVKNLFELIDEVVNKKSRPFYNKSSIPKVYQKLMNLCWVDNPKKRPKFEDIVNILKNDKKFITLNVNEEEYMSYIDYVDQNIING